MGHIKWGVLSQGCVQQQTIAGYEKPSHRSKWYPWRSFAQYSAPFRSALPGDLVEFVEELVHVSHSKKRPIAAATLVICAGSHGGDDKAAAQCMPQTCRA